MGASGALGGTPQLGCPKVPQRMQRTWSCMLSFMTEPRNKSLGSNYLFPQLFCTQDSKSCKYMLRLRIARGRNLPSDMLPGSDKTLAHDHEGCLIVQVI